MRHRSSVIGHPSSSSSSSTPGQGPGLVNPLCANLHARVIQNCVDHRFSIMELLAPGQGPGNERNEARRARRCELWGVRSSVIGHPSSVMRHRSCVIGHPSSSSSSSTPGQGPGLVNPLCANLHARVIQNCVDHRFSIMELLAPGQGPGNERNEARSARRCELWGVRSSVIGHPSSVMRHRSCVIGHPSSVIGHASSVIVIVIVYPGPWPGERAQ